MVKLWGFIVLFLAVSVNTGYSQTYSFMYQSILRSYIVYLPPLYNPSNIYPLVINMHGLTNTAIIQQEYSQFDSVADTANFIVVYPDGISSSWNAGFSEPYNSGIDDVGFLSALIDTMSANYSIDPVRIYSTGMSMGGFMSYRLACELENRIAAIASVTGLMADSVIFYCQSTRTVPVLHIHGTTDPVVNYQGAIGSASVDSTIKYWVKKNNCPGTPVVTNLPDINIIDGSTVTKYYYGLGDDSSEVILYKIINGGHTWPGAITIPLLGNTNKDINASNEIWNFFRKHRLKNPVTSTLIPNHVNPVICYPNPFSDNFSVHMNSQEIKGITISNIYGQIKVNIKTLQSGRSVNICTNNLKNGIYFLKATTKNRTFTTKIIKSNL